MIRAPIALFVYNRPRHTRSTLQALRANALASQSDLFVFSDAARKPEAAAGVEEVRQLLRSIDGFKSVAVVERTSNLGLAASITEGLNELCGRYGRAIVLEDDLATSPHFLDYMNAALERYEPEDRVMQISTCFSRLSILRPTRFFCRSSPRGDGLLGRGRGGITILSPAITPDWPGPRASQALRPGRPLPLLQDAAGAAARQDRFLGDQMVLERVLSRRACALSEEIPGQEPRVRRQRRELQRQRFRPGRSRSRFSGQRHARHGRDDRRNPGGVPLAARPAAQLDLRAVARLAHAGIRA